MIDYGIYEIQKNVKTKKFHIIEQLGGEQTIVDSIEDVVEYIESDLMEIDELTK